MNKNGLRKRKTFKEAILMKPPIFKLPNRLASNIINSPFFDIFSSERDDGFKNYILMLDKETQKDYIIQNHDMFPNMFHKIDAEAKNIENNYQNKSDKIIQTVRYILKDMDTFSSLSSESDKPPSTPPDHNIYKRTPTNTPSEKAESEQKEKEKGKSLLDRYLELFETSPPRTPPMTPSETTPIPVIGKGNNSPTPTLSSSSSEPLPTDEDIDVYELMGIHHPSSSSSSRSWTSQQMRTRSRSRSF